MRCARPTSWRRRRGCLAPISEDLITAGLEKEFDAEFYSSATRDAGVSGGDPFIVEAGIAYGGELPAEGTGQVMRFANRVPLVYQRGACATTDVVKSIGWRNYGLDQPGGSGLPNGPVVIMVHVASTNVPFTSESKDAVANVPEIEDEIELAIREAARDLKSFLNKRRSMEKRRKKQNVLGKILPEMAEKVAEVTERDPPDIDDAIARIMNNVLVERKVEETVTERPSPSSSRTNRARTSRWRSPTSSRSSRRTSPTVQPSSRWTASGSSSGNPRSRATTKRHSSTRCPRTRRSIWTSKASRAKTDGVIMSTNDNEQAREQLIDLAAQFYDQFELGEIPHMSVPTRTKNNIEYDEEMSVWVYGDRESTRSANSVRGARKLLKAIYTIEFLSDQLEQDRSSTLRELYYLSESWDNDEAQFTSQDESNGMIEDLEIVSGVTREDFHMRPEESGAKVMGPLHIREQTNRGDRDIHCQLDVGQGGYQIPNNPDTIEFPRPRCRFCPLRGDRWHARPTRRERLRRGVRCHRRPPRGQPARATRRLTKRFHDELGLPVVVFTDGDPWSYRIYGSVAYGSIKSAHLSEYLATPEADFIGIQPSDIVEYELPTDPLSDSDINALESELEDPRFQTDYWTEQIELQLDIGKKSEQQSLASHGLTS